MEQPSFFQRVYQIVSEIPRGKVITYGQIAFLAGKPRAARMVGFAMRCAPPGLPCHRVVNRKGELAPEHAFGGREFQRSLLEQEGVTFLPNGYIDLKRHLLEL